MCDDYKQLCEDVGHKQAQSIHFDLWTKRTKEQLLQIWSIKPEKKTNEMYIEQFLFIDDLVKKGHFSKAFSLKEINSNPVFVQSFFQYTKGEFHEKEKRPYAILGKKQTVYKGIPPLFDLKNLPFGNFSIEDNLLVEPAHGILSRTSQAFHRYIVQQMASESERNCIFQRKKELMESFKSFAKFHELQTFYFLSNEFFRWSMSDSQSFVRTMDYIFQDCRSSIVAFCNEYCECCSYLLRKENTKPAALYYEEKLLKLIEESGQIFPEDNEFYKHAYSGLFTRLLQQVVERGPVHNYWAKSKEMHHKQVKDDAMLGQRSYKVSDMILKRYLLRSSLNYYFPELVKRVEGTSLSSVSKAVSPFFILISLSKPIVSLSDEGFEKIVSLASKYCSVFGEQDKKGFVYEVALAIQFHSTVFYVGEYISFRKNQDNINLNDHDENNFKTTSFYGFGKIGEIIFVKNMIFLKAMVLKMRPPRTGNSSWWDVEYDSSGKIPKVDPNEVVFIGGHQIRGHCVIVGKKLLTNVVCTV